MAWYKLDEEGNIEGLLKPLAPLINYVARLNGTDQYWQLSDYTLIPQGDDFELSFFLDADLSKVQILMGNDQATSGALFFASGNLRIRGDSGLTIESTSGQAFNQSLLPCIVNISRSAGIIAVKFDSEIIPMNSSVMNEPISINRLGRYSLEQFFLDGYVANFKLIDKGTVIHEIPLTNKAQGATQLATVGNVNATMVGYTGDEWEEV